MTVHSFSIRTTQNSSNNLPSYLQTNIIAQMLSIRGEGGGLICEIGAAKEHGSRMI